MKKITYDPGNLVGKPFKDYIAATEELCPPQGIHATTNQLFDFELYRAQPVFAERYPGLPGSPKDFVGITLKKEKGEAPAPLHTTRITWKDARTYNQQIQNEHSRSGYGKYYLLSLKSTHNEQTIDKK